MLRSGSCLVIIGIAVGTAACWREQRLGQPVTAVAATAVGSVLGDPSQFVGKVIRVEGTVDEVCPMSGCWLVLRDRGAAIHVDLAAAGFTLDRAALGRQAIVQGTVRVRHGTTILIGHGLVLP